MGVISIYNFYRPYPPPHWYNTQMYYNPYNYHYHKQMCNLYESYSAPYYFEPSMMYNSMLRNKFLKLKDYGPNPFVINIDKATKQNGTFRTALWTSEDLQVTLMSIAVDDDIGLEVHPKGDQFIRIEEGQALVRMGDSKDNLDFEEEVYDDYAIMIPAGKWHNVINIGNIPLKLYAIYGPPEHPFNTVHITKEDAEADE